MSKDFGGYNGRVLLPLLLLLQVTDTGLHESKRFLQYMVGVLVLLYFGLVKLMFK